MCMATYGLALNSDGIGIGSGIQFYFALQCLMDVPACIIVLVLADKTRRKMSNDCHHANHAVQSLIR